MEVEAYLATDYGVDDFASVRKLLNKVPETYKMLKGEWEFIKGLVSTICENPKWEDASFKNPCTEMSKNRRRLIPHQVTSPWRQDMLTKLVKKNLSWRNVTKFPVGNKFLVRGQRPVLKLRPKVEPRIRSKDYKFYSEMLRLPTRTLNRKEEENELIRSRPEELRFYDKMLQRLWRQGPSEPLVSYDQLSKMSENDVLMAGCSGAKQRRLGNNEDSYPDGILF
ncbi:Oidioi.mRNA.OKI2018_I69.PAR.g11033.t2.cds [Oikopleura dioica]|uniref:Oidioi.mRNA.OKI2018_I69.PAR.g11033.t2.cds n=1 Tax=Oikopleura dioica TaxID=34765 RepID=A0ABN7S0Z9_OIKDI|nr:Oidioi.mRNA.OKI2018_I69.PAR.g11033.t2.cds [Oikopleura dioica]